MWFVLVCIIVVKISCWIYCDDCFHPFSWELSHIQMLPYDLSKSESHVMFEP